MTWSGISKPTLITLSLALALLGGVLCGEAAWFAAASELTRQPPTGWERDRQQAGWERAEDAGPLRPRPGTRSLEAHRGIFYAPNHDPSRPTSISMTVTIPHGGRLEVWLDAPTHGHTPELVLERIGDPSTQLVVEANGNSSESPCTHEASPPSDRPVPIHIAKKGDDLEVVVADQRWTCSSVLTGPLRPHLRPGLRRVIVDELAIDGKPCGTPGSLPRLLWWLIGGLVTCLLVAFEHHRGARCEVIILGTLPLALAGPLSHADLGPWAEAARVANWTSVSWLGLTIPATAALLVKFIHHLGRSLREPAERSPPPPWATFLLLPPLLARLASRRPLGSSLRILVIGGLGGLAHVSAHGPTLAGGCLTALLIAFATLIWANANAHHIRFYNLTCLIAVCLALASAEAGLRATERAKSWDAARPVPQARGTPQTFQGLEESLVWDFVSMEVQQHSQYPSNGWPVAFPPPDERVRIVVMGGSTTGGAWHNDNLNEFYPARLGELLGPDFLVMNQGVGGWTTWHMRTYLAGGQLERLSPGVLIMYIGHNDALTTASQPYHVLYERWKRGTLHRAGSEWLNRFRLYQGSRYLLESVRPDSKQDAVPIAEAQRNLAWIAAEVVARGGKVILVSEGESPDPNLPELLEYNAMMRRLATDNEGVSYVDMAAILHEHTGAPLFLDNCHLTDRGHRLVAAELLIELQRLGVSPENH